MCPDRTEGIQPKPSLQGRVARKLAGELVRASEYCPKRFAAPTRLVQATPATRLVLAQDRSRGSETKSAPSGTAPELLVWIRLRTTAPAERALKRGRTGAASESTVAR